MIIYNEGEGNERINKEIMDGAFKNKDVGK